MANRVLFGLSNVHYAVYDDEQKKYLTPKPLKGAVQLGITREGDSSIFYADNSPYFSVQTNGGYSGTLELAVLEREVLKDLLGWEIDANGMQIENTEAKQKTFALLYEVSSNELDQRFVFYNCTLSRPENEANTRTETTEPDTQTMDISMIVRELPYGTDTISAVKGCIELTETNSDEYNGFFDEVLLPTKAATPGV